jgi:hypothetical protein
LDATKEEMVEANLMKYNYWKNLLDFLAQFLEEVNYRWDAIQNKWERIFHQ